MCGVFHWLTFSQFGRNALPQYSDIVHFHFLHAIEHYIANKRLAKALSVELVKLFSSVERRLLVPDCSLNPVSCCTHSPTVTRSNNSDNGDGAYIGFSSRPTYGAVDVENGFSVHLLLELCLLLSIGDILLLKIISVLIQVQFWLNIFSVQFQFFVETVILLLIQLQFSKYFYLQLQLCHQKNFSSTSTQIIFTFNFRTVLGQFCKWAFVFYVSIT